MVSMGMISMIETSMFGRKMKNPIVLASGVLGMTRASLETACQNGCGAVTSKSLTMEPRKGHEGPNIVETECGMLNAMGYPNPGIDAGLGEFSGWKRSEPLIISIVGKDEKEFGMLAAKVEDAQNANAKPKRQISQNLACSEIPKEFTIQTQNTKPWATAIEAAISCPHTPGYGVMAGQGTPESVTAITNAIKEKTKLPLIIKLSPSVPGEVKVAEAAEAAGADAINMGNSLGPGMKIDLSRRKPVLGFGMGGLSGSPIKPIAVRCIYDIYQAVDIPIIGTGGVTTGEDAIEMMMAGAGLVGVGSAVYYRGPTAFADIAKEMECWMKKNGCRSVKELIGAAHG